MAGKKKGDDEDEKKSKKPKTLDEIRAEIRKRYPEGAATVIGYEDDADRTLVYATRFPRLNRMLGRGNGPDGKPSKGLMGGAIVEGFGFEDSGKTSLFLALAADVQRLALPDKKHVVFVNYELPQDYKWWRTLGLDTSKANFTQLRPKSLEEGIADAYKLVMTGQVCCLVIDSVYSAAAKARGAMMEKWGGGEGAGAALGVEAVKWGEAWTSMKGPVADHQVVVLAVNQMREKIDTGGGKKSKSWAKPVTTPRGHALKFYAWVRLRIEGGWLEVEKGAAIDGKKVKIRVVKNKTSDDARGMCEYDLIRGVGFDLLGDLITLSLEAGAIKAGGGGNYTIGSHKVRGKEALRAFLVSEPRGPKVQAALQGIVDKHLEKLAAETSRAVKASDQEGESDDDDPEE